MQFIRPAFRPKENPAAVYKITIDRKWIYIGSSLKVRSRITRWVSCLNTGKHFKNKNMRLVLRSNSIIEIEIMEFAEKTAPIRYLETLYLEREGANPYLLNRCPEGHTNVGIKPYFGQILKKNLPRNPPTAKKPIAQFNLNGKLLSTYPSIADTAKALNVKEDYVRRILQGKRGPFKKTIFKLIAPDGTYIEPPVFKRKKAVFNRPPTILRGAANGAAKAVEMLTITGEFIKRFECVRDAAREVGANSQNIHAVISGFKKSCKGYKWRYPA